MSGNPQIDRIEQLKSESKYDEALLIANRILAKNPTSKEALFEIADIEFRKWEIGRAEKPIDFLLSGKGGESDAMSLYIKWVLEMEKTNRQQAKKYFQKAMTLLDEENPEILRCYGLCEYRLGHAEDWVDYLLKAYSLNTDDAEIILTLIEVTIMQEDWDSARQYVEHYLKTDSINYIDKDKDYYDEKIAMFSTFISAQWAQW